MIRNTDACSFRWRHNLCANICILIISKYKSPILLYCQLTITAPVTVAAVATNSASAGSTVPYVLVLWFDFSISVVCFHVRCLMLRIPSMCYV